MGQSCRQNAGGILCDETYAIKRKALHSQFLKEQKRLEDMVSAHFARGVINLGADTGILKQSGVIDKLIVDSMKLEELHARHKED